MCGMLGVCHRYIRSHFDISAWFVIHLLGGILPGVCTFVVSLTLKFTSCKKKRKTELVYFLSEYYLLKISDTKAGTGKCFFGKFWKFHVLKMSNMCGKFSILYRAKRFSHDLVVDTVLQKKRLKTAYLSTGTWCSRVFSRIGFGLASNKSSIRLSTNLCTVFWSCKFTDLNCISSDVASSGRPVNRHASTTFMR